jgi:hypothetical protein
VQYLRQAGVQVNFADLGERPYMLFIEKKNPEIIERVLR